MENYEQMELWQGEPVMEDELDKYGLLTASVQKAKTFVLSRYSMTTQEQKIVLLALSQLKENIESGKADPLEFDIPISKIKYFLGIQGHTIYSTIKNTARRLMTHRIEIQESVSEDSPWEMINPIPYCKYKDGILQVRFDKSMKSQLISAAETYMSRYLLSNFRYMRSSYSIRVYEIMKTFLMDESIPFKDYGWKEMSFSIEEFKLLVGSDSKSVINEKMQITPENLTINSKYIKYGDFKRNVINKALEEVNKYTDINLEFEEKKSSHQVETLVFRFKEKSQITESRKERYDKNMGQIDDLLQMMEIVQEFLPDAKISEIKELIIKSNYNIEQIRMAKVMIDRHGGSGDIVKDISELIEEAGNIPSFRDLAEKEL